MANITRWHPFEDSLDDLVKGLFLRPVRYEAQEPVTVKVDVKEDDKAYTVQAEIPGVRKEDIQVAVDGNQVAISAEIKRHKDEKQGEKVAAHRALLRQGLPRVRAGPGRGPGEGPGPLRQRRAGADVAQEGRSVRSNAEHPVSLRTSGSAPLVPVKRRL